MPYIIIILAGYLLGCSNMAWYLAKLRGVDLLAGGSGNPGTSNALILMGWRAGVLVGIHDIGKGVLAVLLARAVFPGTPGIGETAGAACVLGHMFPIFLKLKGGKGFASFIGMMLALDWKFALIILAGVVIVTVLTDYLVVGTALTVISLPVYMAVGYYPLGAILFVAAVSVIILLKHKENYIRIFKGKEIGLRSTLKGEHRVK